MSEYGHLHEPPTDTRSSLEWCAGFRCPYVSGSTLLQRVPVIWRVGGFCIFLSVKIKSVRGFRENVTTRPGDNEGAADPSKAVQRNAYAADSALLSNRDRSKPVMFTQVLNDNAIIIGYFGVCQCAFLRRSVCRRKQTIFFSAL